MVKAQPTHGSSASSSPAARIRRTARAGLRYRAPAPSARARRWPRPSSPGQSPPAHAQIVVVSTPTVERAEDDLSQEPDRDVERSSTSGKPLSNTPVGPRCTTMAGRKTGRSEHSQRHRPKRPAVRTSSDSAPAGPAPPVPPPVARRTTAHQLPGDSQHRRDHDEHQHHPHAGHLVGLAPLRSWPTTPAVSGPPGSYEMNPAYHQPEQEVTPSRAPKRRSAKL